MSPISGKKAKYLFFILAVVWAGLIVATRSYHVYTVNNTVVHIATNVAKESTSRNIKFRIWATMHGGVYVPKTETTPENIYLSNVEEKNITTPSGKELTLMNPAYMLRQINELFSDDPLVISNLTSLKPINPSNKPNEWERAALLTFEEGETEYISPVIKEGSNRYLRYVQPMITGEGCLKCHAFQGYKRGDVRGGISAQINLETYYDLASAEVLNFTLLLVTIWLIGMVALSLWVKNMLKQEQATKNYVLALQEANSSLETKHNEVASLNEDLRAFSYSVSHDLQAPLRRMRTFLELIKEMNEESFSEKSDRFMAKALSQADNMSSLITQLFKLSDIRNSNLEPAKFNIAEVFRMKIAELAEANTYTTIEPSIPPAIAVTADLHLMEILIDNLVRNAVKFSSDKEVIKIEVSSRQTEDGTEISVKDNGVGFESNYSKDLFEPFFRAHSGSITGSGIGLSIVKRIIIKHGGNVWAESQPEHGATFFFTIPNETIEN
jgi:signal transduction histidine kinase